MNGRYSWKSPMEIVREIPWEFPWLFKSGKAHYYGVVEVMVYNEGILLCEMQRGQKNP